MSSKHQMPPPPVLPSALSRTPGAPDPAYRCRLVQSQRSMGSAARIRHPLPTSIKNAPPEQHQAIRKRQNVESAARSRLRKKAEMKAVEARMETHRAKIESLEQRVVQLVGAIVDVRQTTAAIARSAASSAPIPAAAAAAGGAAHPWPPPLAPSSARPPHSQPHSQPPAVARRHAERPPPASPPPLAAANGTPSHDASACTPASPHRQTAAFAVDDLLSF